MAMSTRKRSAKLTKIFDGGHKFSSTDQFKQGTLPTKQEVIQRMLNEDNFYSMDAARTVASELAKLWIWSNVYPVHELTAARKIFDVMKDFKAIDHYPKKKRSKPAYVTKENQFMSDANDLFDIFCKDSSQRRELEEKFLLRMTQKDHEFYEDQKGPRNAKCLSSIDPLTSSDYRFQRRVQEKQHESCVELFDESCSSSADIEVVSSDCDNTSLSSESSSATLFGISQPSQQNRSNWPNLAKIAERFQISDRAAAALANAVLKDVGLVTENDKKLVIDKNKLRRERQKYREDIRQNQSKFFHMINGVYVDGRKDATLTTSQLDNGKSYQSMHLEEHYVMVGEPGEYYVTHFGTADGKGCSIADGIFSAIKDTELQEKLEVIGSDGAATMTGVNSGCIRTLEVLLKRPLQWVVCLLHTNELPLRHIFQYLDGGTKSPNAFAGPIGKSLDSNSSQWPVITFKPILNPYFPTLPNEVLEELSTDQYYGYRICWAVICGEVDEDLKLLEIGPIVHSRWLTLACRILRLYTATCNPSQSLVTLAEYCLKVYFPTWFEIKCNNKLTLGSINFFNLVQRMVNFPNQNVVKIGLDVLQRNGYFAHPENVLVAMLGDDNEDLRRLAVNKIFAIRSKIPNVVIENDNFEGGFIKPVGVFDDSSTIRKFLIPKINFMAKSYHKMVNMNLPDITEPPATRLLSNEAINSLRLTPLRLDHPCHNQAVERHVKLVTEASAAAATFERRDGIIRQRIHSRKLMKCFETKKQFNV